MSILLTDVEIGDCLDLDKGKTYPCSDKSLVTTVDVDAVAKAQIKKIFEWSQGLCHKKHRLVGDKWVRPTLLRRRNCGLCWAELKREIE